MPTTHVPSAETQSADFSLEVSTAKVSEDAAPIKNPHITAMAATTNASRWLRCCISYQFQKFSSTILLFVRDER